MPQYETIKGSYWASQDQRFQISYGRVSHHFQIAAGPFQLTIVRKPYTTRTLQLRRTRHHRLYAGHLYIGWLSTPRGAHRP